MFVQNIVCTFECVHACVWVFKHLWTCVFMGLHRMNYNFSNYHHEYFPLPSSLQRILHCLFSLCSILPGCIASHQLLCGQQMQTNFYLSLTKALLQFQNHRKQVFQLRPKRNGNDVERTEDCLELCLIHSLIPSLRMKSEVLNIDYS